MTSPRPAPEPQGADRALQLVKAAFDIKAAEPSPDHIVALVDRLDADEQPVKS